MTEPRSNPRKRAATTKPADRFVCVHGHFYQPPRENPWLETVEVQESATPYHDWNERITSECYAPNGASRIQNKRKEIVRIVNNYSRMSFNFGPTLLSWLQDFAPRTYRMILDADKLSAQRFSGHGSAMAQVYNHIIMPLANERDARTQVRWGIADFEHRFGRKPEGMWLAESAVSRSVLDLMAQEGIKFTVLAPSQCAHVRKLAESAVMAPFTAPNGAVISTEADAQQRRSGETPVSAPDQAQGEFTHSTTLEAALLDLPPDIEAPLKSTVPGAYETSRTESASSPEHVQGPWQETPDASVDPSHPYLVRLDKGRSIAIFFYDGPPSRAIAFEGLLDSGETFGKRLVSRFNDDNDGPQLSHVATDGESYGHHHKHGEMALSYALHWIETNNLATLTNYGEFLEKFPPKWEAEVVDNSSWSCFHGVERWRSNCGCNGGKPGWNQEWRGPLREALDLLRDRTAPMAEEVAAPLFKDFWAARDAYIQVVLDRSSESTDRFFAEHATRELTPAERVTAFELLELERHTQLMYTSCGWFFDEISGIETVQIIAYAGRVLQLAAKLFGHPGELLEEEFLKVLARAKSNVPEVEDGAHAYRRFVTGALIDLEHVGAHYAISSMFRSYPDVGELFCFDIERHSYDLLTSGRGRVAIGRASLRSRITEECEEICFAVLHLGDQNLSAAVRRYTAADEAAWQKFNDAARTAIRRADLPQLIRSIDTFFGGTLYSLRSLFADEQHNILRSILDQTLSEVEGSLVRIYEEHATLLHFLSESSVTAPPALALTAGFAINAGLRHALEAEKFDTAEVSRLLRRAETDNVTLDAGLISFTADKRMKRAMVRLEGAGAQAVAVLHETLAIAESLRTLPMEVNLWQAQNIWNDMLRRGETRSWTREWRDGFRKLGRALNIAVDSLVTEDSIAA